MAVEGREADIGDWRPPPWPEDFGERLELLMRMAGLTPEDLADELGVTVRTVRKWLRGGMPAGPNFWGIIMLARGVPGGYDLIMRGGSGQEAESEA